MDSPRGLRDPSLGAFAEAVAEADLVVLLSKRLDHMLELGAAPPFAPGCRFMQVDPEPEALRQAAGNAGDRMLLQVQGDPAGWAAAMAERLAGCSLDAGWRATVDAAVAYRPAEWRGIGSDSPVQPAQLGYAVHDFLAGSADSVFVSDGGEIGQWAQACVNAPHRIINGPAGAIGSALPFALAARTLFPQARIAATLGDGTFGFHPLEIDTAVRHGLPFVAVVGNDARWNAEVQIQHRTYGADRAVGCDRMSNMIADRLEAWFREAGLDSVAVTPQQEVTRRGDEDFPEQILLWAKVAQSRGVQMVADGYLSDAERSLAEGGFRLWAQDSASYLQHYLLCVEGSLVHESVSA